MKAVSSGIGGRTLETQGARTADLEGNIMIIRLAFLNKRN